MAIQIQTATQRFIDKAHDLFKNEQDPEKRWPMMIPLMREMLADPEVQERSKLWPDCVVTDRAENLLLYEDPTYGFVLNGLVKPANRVAPTGWKGIHDHAHIYTVYGVLDGAETIERYERLDDGSKADYAEIRQTAVMDVVPGVVDLVRPWEIHCEVNGAKRSVALILRSEKSGGFLQGRYDPDTNRYWQGLGPRQTPFQGLP